MSNKIRRWEILGQLKKSAKVKDIVDALLINRELKTNRDRKEFLKPTLPNKISLKDVGIRSGQVNKAIERIIAAIKNKENIIIYGDYDADGVCATAVLWEVLYALNKNTLPYIPDRFSEGYGLNAGSVNKLKTQNPKLKVIITVDNAIVANEAVDVANKLGIDVIITDHHQKGKELPRAQSIIHTDELAGVGVAWILAREIAKKYKTQNLKPKIENVFDLVAIGTIADQVSLLGANRSFVKYGLESLSHTARPGLLALLKEAGLDIVNKVRNLTEYRVGTYEVGFVIAPRINAMGRLEHALDSLRLLCTTNNKKAQRLAATLGKTNKERQRIVGEVVLHAKERAKERDWKGVIVISHESYGEGVIGLAASKLVEEYYRPTIVISRGKKISKASARSISGFNIIEAVRSLEEMIIGGGGHPMAAGFSIKTDKIELFSKALDRHSLPLLTDEILQKKLKIDFELEFNQINWNLIKRLAEFEPHGIGNQRPTFATKKVNILDIRAVGKEGKHLKLRLEKDGEVFGAIAFGFGDYYTQLLPQEFVDIAYNVEENNWNGRKSLELKIRDIKID